MAIVLRRYEELSYEEIAEVLASDGPGGEEPAFPRACPPARKAGHTSKVSFENRQKSGGSSRSSFGVLI